MLKRNCLAFSLLEVIYLRNLVELAALYNLVALYLKETKIEIRLSLKPEKCRCLIVASKQKLTRLSSSNTKIAYN